MRGERVKFYSIFDLTCGINLKLAEPIIVNHNETTTFNDINDIIELYNIKRYFDNALFLPEWTQEIRTKYTDIVNTFSRIIGMFFHSIADNNLVSTFNSLDIEYTDDFWHLFDRFQIFQSISNSIFSGVFCVEKFMFSELLKHKKTVSHYGVLICEHIMSDSKNAELIIDKYMAEDRDGSEINFPSELSLEKMQDLILQYINSEEPHPNYLDVLSHVQNSKNFCIPDTTKLLALKRHEEIIQEYFKRSKGFSHSTAVRFLEQPQEVIIKINTTSSKFYYSLAWIRENLDFPTLLNNLIYLFQYTDTFYRSNHVHSLTQMGITERTIRKKAKNEYFTGMAFEQIQFLSLLQMQSYRDVLRDNGIRLEDVFRWFFSDYLLENFNIDGFNIIIPSDTGTDLEKIRTLAPEIENIFRQFTLFVEYGHIDSDLLEIANSPTIETIPSFIERKYIYGKGDVYLRAVYYLFSDQSHLGYIRRLKKSFGSFFSLLSSENVRLDDYQPWMQPDLDWMIQNNIIIIDQEEFIRVHKRKAFILGELYHHDVACRCYLKNYSEELKWFESREMIRYESKLFSEPEQDYLNYLLNNSKFSNSLALRNNYTHGKQQKGTNIHARDYNYFLNILALVIIKINEEFCLRQEFLERGEPFSKFQQA